MKITLNIFSGADVTGLFLRFFNIVRGQLFCGIVSLAIVPWKLLSTLSFRIQSLQGHLIDTDEDTSQRLWIHYVPRKLQHLHRSNLWSKSTSYLHNVNDH
jgi:hypothetical protein